MAQTDDHTQGDAEKRKQEREQAGGLANQNITRPAPIDQPNDEKKRPEPADLANRNITKPGLAE